jgi:uncharacterized protein YbjQ (UPF0145 family)
MGWFSGTTDDILVTTTSDFGSTKTITEYLGVVTGEAIIGANIFRDMFSSVRDVVGGRAGGYEKALAGARGDALIDLKNAAREIGANAIVGVDFDYEVMGEANGMMMVAVSGTAVKIS